jgi:transcriptional regulator with XRE-family HTH domain
MTTQLKTAQDLTDLRTRLGLSREDLAAKLGVTPSAVGKWERGVTFPSGRRLKALYDLDEAHGESITSAPQPEPVLTLHEYMDRTTQPIPQVITEALNPQTVTIDWQALVGEHQGIRGVSLRHLVELGLYAAYRDAEVALVKGEFLRSTQKLSHTAENGGRPGSDYIITDLRAVQRFCSRARTEMGTRILDVILDHHDELQAMLAGDEQAEARHEQAKSQAPPSADPLDALASMIEQMRSQRDAIEAQAKRQQQLEEKTEQVVQLARRLETTPLAGERSAYQVAEEAGVKSNTGRPHSSAVVALIAELGLHKEGLAWQVPCEISGKIADTWRVNSAGAAKLKYTLAQLAKQGVVLEDGRTRFTVQGSTRQYTVYR